MNTSLFCCVLAFALAVPLFAEPIQPLSAKELQARATHINLVRVEKLQAFTSHRGGVFDRYSIIGQHALKGGPLPSPVNVAKWDRARLELSVTPFYAILILSETKDGNFTYVGRVRDQCLIQLELDPSQTEPADFTTLVRTLLFSKSPENIRLGLGLSRGMDDPQIGERQRYFITTGTPAQAAAARAALAPVNDQPADGRKDRVAEFLAQWKTKWNLADVPSLRAMLDRGDPPYIGERSDENVEAKLRDHLKLGHLSSIQVSRTESSDAGVTAYVLFDFNGKVRDGVMLIRLPASGPPLLENFTIQ